MTRVGDTFCRQLAKKGEDFDKLYAFAELIQSIGKDGVPDVDVTPIGLAKMKDLGLKHPILEMDLIYHAIDYLKFGIKDFCHLIGQRMKWIRTNLAKDARIFINFRDFSDCMNTRPERVLEIVQFLSSLPDLQRPFGLLYEETGKFLPEELGVWTAAVRRKMDNCGFKTGHLLVHVHEQWGLANTTQLECLINGATGIWASLCEEGAAMGHACTTVTMMNLVRLGNKRILQQYHCAALRKAAQNVTHITTGAPAPPKQILYGERAIDMVFGMPNFPPTKAEFDIAGFFGEEPVLRISTLASAKMVADKLKKYFAEDPQFTEEVGQKMKEVMLKDLNNNRKEEYSSAVGLAILFDRSGGKLTESMCDSIADEEPRKIHSQELIAGVRKIWDEWDMKEAADQQNDECLEFDSFYNGFMAPYFGCYRCDETKQALKAIDMDSDGKVDWNEFAVYLKWAVRQYPDTLDPEALLSVAFRKGLIPAMQDELIKNA